ncbi:MAG: FkbM family methyltransferase [Acidimicrobiales bacterium]
MIACRSAAKRVRSWPPANRLLTGAGKAVFRDHAPEFVMAHLPRQGEVEVTLPTGATLRLWSQGDDWITSRVWWQGLAGYEPEMVTPFLRFAATARTVIDVGAFVGFYALLAARTNPAARVFAFEPNPDLAARIGRNVSLNHGLRVTVLPYAAGASQGPASFYLGGDWLPSSSGLSVGMVRPVGTMPTATVDLDSFVRQWGLEGSVDLVKVDVELAEPEVLSGMPETLRRDRPVLFCEVLPDSDLARLEGSLSGLGYCYFHLTPPGPRPESSLVPHEKLFNHLLCPEEKLPDWLAR